MKLKYIMIFILGIGLASPLWAASCEEGYEVTGKNGHVYCVSNADVNWWTAFSWCQKQGRKLASMPEICNNDKDRWNGETGQKCKNIMGSSSADFECWSATPFTPSYSYVVRIRDGYASNWNERRGKRHALCY